jgi:hypothetical protein
MPSNMLSNFGSESLLSFQAVLWKPEEIPILI